MEFNRLDIDTLQYFTTEQKFFILHKLDSAWNISNVRIVDSSICGRLAEIPTVHMKFKSEDGKFRYIKSKNESEILNEVHIYFNGVYTIQENGICVPISEFYKMEIYMKDKGRTVGSWVAPGLGSVVIGILILIGLGVAAGGI
jgi:hypothetical protein